MTYACCIVTERVKQGYNHGGGDNTAIWHDFTLRLAKSTTKRLRRKRGPSYLTACHTLPSHPPLAMSDLRRFAIGKQPKCVVLTCSFALRVLSLLFLLSLAGSAWQTRQSHPAFHCLTYRICSAVSLSNTPTDRLVRSLSCRRLLGEGGHTRDE